MRMQVMNIGARYRFSGLRNRFHEVDSIGCGVKGTVCWLMKVP
jgi:hypothetical protein